MQNEAWRNVRPLETDRVLARILLPAVKVDAALADRKEELEVVKVPVVSRRQWRLETDAIERDLGSGVAEQESLDVFVALIAVDDSAITRVRSMNVGPE